MKIHSLIEKIGTTGIYDTWEERVRAVKYFAFDPTKENLERLAYQMFLGKLSAREDIPTLDSLTCIKDLEADEFIQVSPNSDFIIMKVNKMVCVYEVVPVEVIEKI